jgi:hypothetical protein
MADELDRWEIDQDDDGRPLVRHRHQSGPIEALLTRDADGAWSARCPRCSERMSLPPRSDSGLRSGEPPGAV